MSRDLDAAIEELKSFKLNPADNKGDILRNKTNDFIQRRLSPSTDIKDLIREAKELIEEWEYAYFGWPEAADARQAILAKLESARAAALDAPKNTGGRPVRFEWAAFWAEVVRIAITPEGLPDRPNLQRQMVNWCAEKWGDEVPADATIRNQLEHLRGIMRGY
jgi:hypothetical protein